MQQYYRGEVGGGNIANHFAGLYSKLYNQKPQANQTDDLMTLINGKISNEDVTELGKINQSLIIKGLKQMKGGKRDGTFNFQSDCLIDGPVDISLHLSNLIRMFISHGFVPDIIF